MSLLEKTADGVVTDSPVPGRQPGLQLLLWMLKGIRVGELDVQLPDGRVQKFAGREPGPCGVLRILHPRMVQQVVRNGAIGFGEAYMEGHWDSPDLATLLQMLYANEQHYLGPYEKNRWVQRCHRLMHKLRANTRRQARKNIRHHYDLGNDFYRLWLDPALTYSSAVFSAPDQTLEQAQSEKYRRMLARLDLHAGHHLLEIGSGWGGFALYAARETGCRVTGLTLSREQLAEARARASAQGLADRVHFELRDYRDEYGRYDRIVSIEMYEAVGEEFWPGYFATLARCLLPGGRVAIQGIMIHDDIFPSYRRQADFIQKYIFPGGMLASATVFQEGVRAVGLVPADPAFHGLSYAETLRHWHHNVLCTREAIVSRHGERFFRMWRYYLAYCECGFRSGSLDLMQLTLFPASS
ncbi:MAG: cyclopropane-fatty-acyl-phospholipid synthase family protein [Nevskiales bacterium]|nr:cyclopropane-fatty-acyl-phospholipid synthase family protein [Nevskiales bacterium]